MGDGWLACLGLSGSCRPFPARYTKAGGVSRPAGVTGHAKEGQQKKNKKKRAKTNQKKHRKKCRSSSTPAVLQGAFVKSGDFIKFKGFSCGIPGEQAILRKSKAPRKSPEKWTFLSLAFFNAPSLRTVNLCGPTKPKIRANGTKEFSEQFEGVTGHYPVKQGF